MQVTQLFHQDAKLLSDLVALLNKEQSTLVEMDIDEMERILDLKSALIQRITESSRQRHQALASEGFDANENGMANWIRANEREHSAWQAFQANLEKAKELNRVNGQVINQHFKRNQQALNQLQGQPVNNNTGLYGANGQTSTAKHSRAVLSV